MGENNPGASAETQAVDVGAIQAAASTQAQARIKAILASEEGKALPTLANHLAFDTGVTAEAAIATLKAAKSDQPAPAPIEEPKPDTQASFEDRKQAAGALGLATPDTRETGAAAHAAGWQKAVAQANRRFG